MEIGEKIYALLAAQTKGLKSIQIKLSNKYRYNFLPTSKDSIIVMDNEI